MEEGHGNGGVPIAPQASPVPRLRFGWLAQHPSIVIAALTGSFVTIRVTRAAHGNLETALELLQTGTASVLFAAALDGGIAVLFMACMIIVQVRSLGRGWYVSPAIVIPTALVTGLVVPLIFVLSMAGLLFLIAVARGLEFIFPRMDVWHSVRAWGLPVLIGYAALLTLTAAIVSDTVWMPAEVVTLESGEQVVGYVVQDDGESLRLIRNDDRAVTVVDAGDIVDRQVCSRYGLSEDDEDYSYVLYASWLLRSPLGYLGDSPDYPLCADFQA
jgi:hypothetical protein